jgi:hypothetical protein
VASKDPVASIWLDHVRRRGGNDRAIFSRRWLDRDVGEETSATFGAFNLDLKRIYVEMRPELRYVYVVARKLESEVLEHLLWDPVPELSCALDGIDHQMEMLDMGPASVEGWLTRIIANELGVGEDRLAPYVNLDANELQLADRRVVLTPLEAGFVARLLASPDRAHARPDRERLGSPVRRHQQRRRVARARPAPQARHRCRDDRDRARRRLPLPHRLEASGRPLSAALRAPPDDGTSSILRLAIWLNRAWNTTAIVLARRPEMADSGLRDRDRLARPCQ